MAGLQEKLDELKQSLLEYDVALEVRLNGKLHDREVRLDHGRTIKVSRAVDFYQKPEGWYAVGASNLSLRPCLERRSTCSSPCLRGGDLPEVRPVQATFGGT